MKDEWEAVGSGLRLLRELLFLVRCSGAACGLESGKPLQTALEY